MAPAAGLLLNPPYGDDVPRLSADALPVYGNVSGFFMLTWHRRR